MKAKVIIGANFGDEGKGLMTDYMCYKNEKPIVIRFNSGSQAGHTACTSDGLRHVFGHFGAGTLQEVPTYLSSYFVVNPLTFLKEYYELESKGIEPIVYADKECLVTLPFDMMINQIVEDYRGDKRHGSCGLGFNETIERNKIPKYRIRLEDLTTVDFPNKLLKIQEEYVDDRLKALGVDEIDENMKSILKDFNITANFIRDTAEFLKLIKPSRPKRVLNKFKTLVFEGAQGLMLHENHKYFPHVTHSKTGMDNVSEFLNKYEFKIEDIEVIYITRSYLTRHGAGPLPGELNYRPYSNIEDLTNIPNKYQGALRFAYLNLDILKENIEFDFMKASEVSKYPMTKSIAITCLDQICNENAKYIEDNKLIETSSIVSFIDDVFDRLNVDNGYASYSPYRNKIYKLL